jgi:two-component system chemotaxis response regulator CheY
MKRVLIIDDEKELQEIYGISLKSVKFDGIEYADDGLDAFVKCMTQKFDLITLDHKMPFMDGVQFLTALRSKENINRHTPIFLISSYIPQIKDSTKAFENTYFFDKPIDIESFKRNARMILNQTT